MTPFSSKSTDIPISRYLSEILLHYGLKYISALNESSYTHLVSLECFQQYWQAYSSYLS